jgi:hypothetical protein
MDMVIVNELTTRTTFCWAVILEPFGNVLLWPQGAHRRMLDRGNEELAIENAGTV